MNKKIIFLDIDGTLFSPKISGTPPSAIKAIKMAKEVGHKVFLCTGRSLAASTKYFYYPVDGYIFGSGSCVYVEGKKIYDHPLKEAQLDKLMDQLEKLQIPYILEATAGIYGNQRGVEYIVDYYSSYETDKKIRAKIALSNNVFHIEDYVKEDKVYKICIFIHDDKELIPLKKNLDQPFILTLSAKDPRSDRYITEITNGNETKAEGIKKVITHLSLAQEDTIGIGDSANDISMLDYCAVGIAMGNGADIAKEHADFITKDILDDGIYYAFEKYGLFNRN